MLVLYRLDSGCKWHLIPILQIAPEVPMGWQTIYHHFRKWLKEGSSQTSWLVLLTNDLRTIDMSSVQFASCHLPAKKGGGGVGYHGRKASNTTNSLFLANNSDQMIAMSPPQAGSHHDFFEIEKAFKEMDDQLKSAGIDTRGIFLSAEAEFDSNELRSIYTQNEIEANIKINPINAKQSNQETHFFDENSTKDE